MDQTSVSDLRQRVTWRALIDDLAKRKFQAFIVFKLDRAFRSVKAMHNTLNAWETVDVSFRRVREWFATSTAMGRLLPNLLASLAEFELEMIRERVVAGMDGARRQGKHIGPPRVEVILGKGFYRRFASLLPRLRAGELSQRKAAEELRVSPRTFRRLLSADIQNRN